MSVENAIIMLHIIEKRWFEVIYAEAFILLEEITEENERVLPLFRIQNPWNYGKFTFLLI